MASDMPELEQLTPAQLVAEIDALILAERQLCGREMNAAHFQLGPDTAAALKIEAEQLSQRKAALRRTIMGMEA